MTSLLECIVLLKHYVRMSLGAPDVMPRVVLVFPTKPNADFFQKFVGEDQAQAACYIAGGGGGSYHRMAGLDVTITDDETMRMLDGPGTRLETIEKRVARMESNLAFEDEHRILGRMRGLEAHRVAIGRRVYALDNAQAALERRVLQIEQGADYRASVGRS